MQCFLSMLTEQLGGLYVILTEFHESARGDLIVTGAP